MTSAPPTELCGTPKRAGSPCSSPSPVRRPGRRARGARPRLRQEPGSRIPPISPTSCARSRPATPAASIPTGPAPHAPAGAGAPGLERAEPLRTTLTPQYEGTTAVSPGYLPRDAERLLRGSEGGRPRDARGHRRDRSLRRSSRWQPGAGRWSSGDRRSARRPGRRSTRRSARASGAAQGRRLPGELRRARTSSDQHLRGPAPARPQLRTTPRARTSTASRASSEPRSGPGRCCRDRHPLWATEMWWDSNPPTSPGSPPGRQARWIEDALYQAWKDGASVVINLAIRDFTTSGLQGGTGSGIFFADGRPKPSYTAFRFPFVTDRINRRADPRLGQGSGRGQAGDPAKRGKRWRGREEAPGAPGAGVPHQAAAARQAPPTRVVAGNRSLALDAALDRWLVSIFTTAAYNGGTRPLPRERHAFEKGPGNRRGPGRLPGHWVGDGGDGEDEEEEEVRGDDHPFDYVNRPEPICAVLARVRQPSPARSRRGARAGAGRVASCRSSGVAPIAAQVATSPTGPTASRSAARTGPPAPTRRLGRQATDQEEERRPGRRRIICMAATSNPVVVP